MSWYFFIARTMPTREDTARRFPKSRGFGPWAAVTCPRGLHMPRSARGGSSRQRCHILEALFDFRASGQHHGRPVRQMSSTPSPGFVQNVAYLSYAAVIGLTPHDRRWCRDPLKRDLTPRPCEPSKSSAGHERLRAVPVSRSPERRSSRGVSKALELEAHAVRARRPGHERVGAPAGSSPSAAPETAAIRAPE